MPVFLSGISITRWIVESQPTLASGRLENKLVKVSGGSHSTEAVAVESALRVMSGERGAAQSMSRRFRQQLATAVAHRPRSSLAPGALADVKSPVVVSISRRAKVWFRPITLN